MARIGFTVDKWLAIVARTTVQLSSDLTTDGEQAYDSTLNKAIIRSNGINDPVVLEQRAATLTNKTINGAMINGATIATSTFDLPGSTFTGIIVEDSTINSSIINGQTASNSSIITLPQANLSVLQGLTRVAGTIVYATDTNMVYLDNGTSLSPIGGNFITSSTQSITDGSTATISLVIGLQYLRVVGNGGPITLANAPFGSSAPSDGTTLVLVGQDDTNTVSLTSQDISKGALLNGSCTLGLGQTIELQYDLTLDRFVEISRNSF